MVSTAGFLSSYQSINFSISSSSIVCLAKLTNRKRRLTLNSEGNPQQLTMELASLASLSFIMVRKRQLLGSCAVRDHWSWSELIFYIYVRKLWWIWFGRSFATLIALYWFRKKSAFQFSLQFLDGFFTSRGPDFIFVWCQGIPAKAAPFPLHIIHWSWTKLRQWFTFELFLFFLFVFHSQICRARKLLRA